MNELENLKILNTILMLYRPSLCKNRQLKMSDNSSQSTLFSLSPDASPAGGASASCEGSVRSEHLSADQGTGFDLTRRERRVNGKRQRKLRKRQYAHKKYVSVRCIHDFYSCGSVIPKKFGIRYYNNQCKYSESDFTYKGRDVCCDAIVELIALYIIECFRDVGFEPTDLYNSFAELYRYDLENDTMTIRQWVERHLVLNTPGFCSTGIIHTAMYMRVMTLQVYGEQYVSNLDVMELEISEKSGIPCVNCNKWRLHQCCSSFAPFGYDLSFRGRTGGRYSYGYVSCSSCHFDFLEMTDSDQYPFIFVDICPYNLLCSCNVNKQSLAFNCVKKVGEVSCYPKHFYECVGASMRPVQMSGLIPDRIHLDTSGTVTLNMAPELMAFVKETVSTLTRDVTIINRVVSCVSTLIGICSSWGNWVAVASHLVTFATTFVDNIPMSEIFSYFAAATDQTVRRVKLSGGDRNPEVMAAFGLASIALKRSLPKDSMVAEFIKTVQEAEPSYHSGSVFVSYMVKLFVQALNFLRGKVGYDAFNSKEDIEKWYNEVQVRCTKEYEKRLVSNEEECRIVESLYTQGLKISRILDDAKVPITERGAFTSHMMALARLRDVATNSGAGLLAPRPEPLLCHMFGESQVGKSVVMWILAIAALKERNVEDDRVFSSIYSRKVGQDFWDAYDASKIVVVYDDIGVVRDRSQSPNPEWMEAIYTNNVQPLPLHMASLSEKATTFFRSEVILWNSNHRVYTMPSLTHEQAVHNRIDLQFEQKVRPEYGIKCDGRDYYMADYHKISQLPTMQRGEAYIFDQYDPKTGILIQRDLSFDEVLKMYVQADKEKQQHSQSLIQFIKDYSSGYKKVELSGWRDWVPFLSTPSEDVVEEIPWRLPAIEWAEWNSKNLPDSSFGSWLLDNGQYKLSKYAFEHLAYRNLHVDEDKFKLFLRSMYISQRLRLCSGQQVLDHFGIEPDDFETRYLTGAKFQSMVKPLDDIWRFFRERLWGHIYEAKNCGEKDTASGFVCSVWNAIPESIRFSIIWTGVTCAILTLFAKVYTAICKTDKKKAKKIKVSVSPYAVDRTKGVKRPPIKPKGGRGSSVRPVKLAAMTDLSWPIVSKLIYKNQYRLDARYDNSSEWKRVQTITFVQGRVALCNSHSILSLQNYESVRISNSSFPDGIVLPVDRLQCCLASDLWDVEDVSSDLGMLIFPKIVHEHSDIVKWFVPEKYLLDLDGGTKFHLVGYDHLNKQPVARVYTHSGIRVCKEGYCDENFSKDVVCIQGMEYNLETPLGSCGSLVVLKDVPYNERICGMHFASMDDGGVSMPVSQDSILSMLETIDEDARVAAPELDTIVFPEVQFKEKLVEFSGAPLKEVPTGFSHCGVLTCDLPGRPRKSNLFPSPVSGVIQEPTTKPAHLMYTVFDDGVKRDVLVVAAEKAAGAPQLINVERVEVCAQAVSHLVNSRQKKYQRVFTYDEAIKGIDGEPYIASLDRSTSAGWPWSLNRDGKPGKEKWLGKDLEFILDHPELKSAVENRIQKACKGERTFTLWVDTAKDERRPIAKVDAGKTRLFSAGPLDFTIAFRQYFLGFANHMMTHRIDVGSCVGVNPFGLDWNRIACGLKTKGPHCGAGDFHNFDGWLISEVMWAVLKVVEDFYDNSTLEERRIRRILWSEIVNSMHLLNSSVVNWTHSQPSGNPFTAILNSIYNLIVMCYAFLILMERALGYSDVKKFFEWVRVYTFGDDHVYSIHESILQWFNQNALREIFAEMGVEYTDETKTGVMPDYRKLEEISFLKRSFRWDKDQSRFRGPLTLETILEMGNWVHGRRAVHENCSQTLEMAVLELGQHSREVFEEHFPKFVKCLPLLQPYPVFPTYDWIQRNAMLQIFDV